MTSDAYGYSVEQADRIGGNLAELHGGELGTDHGGELMDRCWRFPSCAASKRFCQDAISAGLRAWGSADMAGVLVPADPAWGTWRPNVELGDERWLRLIASHRALNALLALVWDRDVAGEDGRVLDMALSALALNQGAYPDLALPIAPALERAIRKALLPQPVPMSPPPPEALYGDREEVR